MSGQKSLADIAVSALAAIQKIDDGIDLEHPERHAIREMKRIAEQTIIDACRIATLIANASQTVRGVVAELQQEGKDNGS